MEGHIEFKKMIRDKNLSKNSGGYLGTGAILLAILAGTMALTNPPKEEYIEYASGRLSAELKESYCKESEAPEILENFNLSKTFATVCNNLLTSQRPALTRHLDNATQRQNNVVFSIYTTQLWDRRYRTIGVFGNFLTFSSDQVTESSLPGPRIFTETE
ncbi:MAG: DUF4359 domain-containing protein [Microcoleaceae cyanobacterium]